MCVEEAEGGEKGCGLRGSGASKRVPDHRKSWDLLSKAKRINVNILGRLGLHLFNYLFIKISFIYF